MANSTNPEIDEPARILQQVEESYSIITDEITTENYKLMREDLLAVVGIAKHFLTSVLHSQKAQRSLETERVDLSDSIKSQNKQNKLLKDELKSKDRKIEFLEATTYEQERKYDSLEFELQNAKRKIKEHQKLIQELETIPYRKRTISVHEQIPSTEIDKEMLEQIQDLQRDIVEIQSENSCLQENYEYYKTKSDKATCIIDELSHTIQKLNEKIDKTRSKNTTLSVQLESQESEIKTLLDQIRSNNTKVLPRLELNSDSDSESEQEEVTDSLFGEIGDCSFNVFQSQTPRMSKTNVFMNLKSAMSIEQTTLEIWNKSPVFPSLKATEPFVVYRKLPSLKLDIDQINQIDEDFSYSETSSVSVSSGQQTTCRKHRPSPKRKEPVEEYFRLTCQVAKINSKQMDKIWSFPVDDMYKAVLSQGIPFNQWHDWVKDQIEIYVNILQ